jgi:NADH-quinone oxidoreductase subunit N
MYAQMLTLVAPQLILTLGGIIMLLVAAYAGDRRSVAVNWLGIASLAAAIAAVAMHDGIRAFVFAGTVKVDAYGSFAQYLIYGAAIVSLLLAPRYFEREGYRAEYPVLIVFAALGMGLMVSAHDLMTLYIGLELNSLAAYVLASFARRDARSSEAGLKYFVLGSLASGMLLYGMSLLYGFTGTTAFRGIVLAYSSAPQMGVLFGLVFTMVGLGFKISAVPFHMWTPDVYEGAPTPVTAFFASAPKVAAVALLVRVSMEALPAGRDAWQQIIAFMAVASMVFGAVAAIGQRNIKRLLAYSSIANVGFILVGLAAATSQGVQSVLFYLTVYVVMTLGSFLVVLQLKTRDGEMVEDLAALAGLWRQKPWLAAALSIFMFSLAGIPPLFGFWPKLLVFQAAIGAGLTWLALVGAIASVIGAFYYLRVIKVMLFDPPSDIVFADNGGWLERLLIAVAALYVSVLGFILIAPLGAATARAAGALI